MNYKRGFTLIELLAVILILGIISVIAVPTVTSVIEDSKKGSLKSTASILAEAAERQCQIEQMKGSTITKSYGITNGILSSPLDVKGLPNSGTITVDDECNANVAIADDNYCVIKSDGITSINSNINNCSVTGAEIPVTRENCFIFDESTHTITGYNYSDTTCPSKISIPEKINNIPVEHIGDYAFFNANYEYLVALGYNADVNTDNPIPYIYYSPSLDIETNVIKNFSNIGYHRFINILNKNLKKYCYRDDGTYDEKSYDYLMTDTDTYTICNLNIQDEATEIEHVSSTGITAVDFSKAINLLTIGDGAFTHGEITSVKFGELPNLTSLGISSFSFNEITGILDLSGLTGIGEIDNDAFGDNNITDIIFPNNLTRIGFYEFASNNIVELNIPDSLTMIDYSAFTINHIKNLTIPNNVVHIMDLAFYDNDIENLTITNQNIQDIYYLSFGENQISQIDLPDNLLTIETGAFSNNLITEIDIPNSVTYLSGFDGNSISVISIPSSVNEIGSYAFDSNNITNLTIPDTVEYVYPLSFYGNIINTLSLGKNIIGIGDYAFGGGRSTISSVVLPNTLTEVYSYTFYNTKITNLTIGDNVTSIGECAFYKSYISNLIWGTTNKLTTIEKYAFQNFKANTIDIPSGVTTIGPSAFVYASSETVNIPDSVTTIGYSAFSGMGKLLTANIGSGITRIQSNGFACYNGETACSSKTININRIANAVSGSPWGNQYATINWTGTN